MDRRVVNTLVIDDKDLECNCDSITLKSLNISNVGFISSDLEKFDLIVYKGKKGQKILKSAITKTGIIN